MAGTEPDALEQLLQVRCGGNTGNLRLIGLLNAETRVHQTVGQVAVVGEQQESFAVLIKPADRVHGLIDLGHEVDGQRPVCGIAVGIDSRAAY